MMTMNKPGLVMDAEAPVKGIVAQVVTMLNGQAQQQRASLPVRTARLLQRSRATTPSDGLSDGSVSPAPANLLQDVVDIKTLLLQLKRVLQEPGGELHSMSSETLDPLAVRGNNGRKPPAASPLHPDATTEMKRQILYLQSQLEERDRVVRVLQQQMLRMSEGHEARNNTDDTCNVATQTDRLRPPTTTPLTSSEPSGLVSWNEHGGPRKLTTYSEAQRSRTKVNNVKCTCGARLNGQTDTNTPDPVTTNSRIGSKYLQAVANKSERLYVKRDSSLDANRNFRKYNLYSTRSKSIENFQNHTKNDRFDTKTVIEESPLVKHQSYSDLYNGRISSKDSVNRHSPSLNGQSTDTDYSSDGGYKSLPSSINYKSVSPRKISGIPRRAVETRFISTKSVKASAV